ncbi:MAG: membrane protein insertion efficiency factor YidD [Gammaproteobacteria bacterium]|nr:membrane protein insertion efficiency factor YidD [Gammaproteobacteria bacterium]|tara:strand:- start:914 stop:1165 length:252 start_codon:yes stop_codon:yes gene_type:complete
METIKKIIATAVIYIIRIYQLILSPMLPSSCRHIPTCSEYAITALKTHGLIHGTLMSARRIFNCRPGGTHGYDPVKPKEEKNE